MKLLKIPLVIIFLLQNCITEHSIERTYIIENGTKHSIKIKFYKREFDIDTRMYVVNVNLIRNVKLDQKGDTWQIYHSEDMTTIVNSSWALGSDSIIVIYDNSKINYYSIRGDYPNNRNLLYNNSYIVESNELYRYIFTEEDYKQAEDL